jgi:hypothetical protein
MYMKSKDIAIVGILLAIGAILRYFLAMLNTPLTPNMIIAFYCLAIILLKPKLYEALGIGIVAGVLSMLISSSVFPVANLISEPVGAYVCFIFYEVLRHRENLAPMITTFIATLASGFTFAGIATLFVGATILTMYHGNFSEFFAVYVPIVVITAVFNAVIVQILYIPLSRVMKREWNDQAL